MATECPYVVLGVDESADLETVRRCFRARAHACHPDHGGDRQEFEALMAAFRTVCARQRQHRRRAGANPYAGFLRSLDAVARRPVPAPARVERRASEPSVPSVPGVHAFAALLAAELAQ